LQLSKSTPLHKEIQCFDVKNEFVFSMGTDQKLKKTNISTNELQAEASVDIKADFIKTVPGSKNLDEVIIGNTNQLKYLNITS